MKYPNPRMKFFGWANIFSVLFTRVMAFDFSSYISQKLTSLKPTSHTGDKCPVTPEHLEAARLCHLVYDDEYLHKSERFVDSPSTDVQCSMSVDKHILYVVFRGSDDRTDWSHNFNMNLVEYPPNSRNQIHAGFLVQWLSVKEDVNKKVSDMIEISNGRGKPIKTIVFAGHSAGSPPACLCAKELELDSVEVRVITFGSPRFSNQAFKTEFETSKQCTRIVLDRDLVTRFPINFYNGYAHVGKPLQLMEGNIVLQRETTNFETFKWFLFGIPDFDFGVRDHDIRKYCEEIESYLTLEH